MRDYQVRPWTHLLEIELVVLTYMRSPILKLGITIPWLVTWTGSKQSKCAKHQACVHVSCLCCSWNYSLDFSAMMGGHWELHTSINPVSPRLLSVREFYHGNRDETRTEQEKGEQQQICQLNRACDLRNTHLHALQIKWQEHFSKFWSMQRAQVCTHLDTRCLQ